MKRYGDDGTATGLAQRAGFAALSDVTDEKMPLIYTIDEGRRRIRIVLSDPVSEAELLDAIDRQAAEGTWGYGLLCDMRLLGPSPRTGLWRVAIQHVAEITAREGARGPVAVVANTGALVGVSEAYAGESRRAGRAVQVFWSPDDATEWLDRQPPSAGGSS
jgi:hypothetical protein